MRSLHGVERSRLPPLVGAGKRDSLLALAEEGNDNSNEARKRFAEVASYNFNSVGFALTRKDAAARSN